MNTIKIDKISDFGKFVDSLEVNTRYVFPDNYRYESLWIGKGTEHYSNRTYFTWSMEYNYKISGSVGYIHPLSGTNKVTHFKTEKGAKTNFKKRYAYYFEPLCVC